MTVSIAHLLFLSFAVFCIGGVGFLLRKNTLSLLICLELMLSAVNMAFVSFSRLHQNDGGNILYFFVITVAACESAVGLAIILNFFRIRKNIRLDDARTLQG
jgi:NADH-quinone oxidoreductase subunit K